MKLSLFSCLVLLGVSILPVHISVSTPLVLYKRQNNEPARVTGNTWGSGNGLSPMAKSATDQQLSYLGFSEKRGIAEWREYIAEVQQNFRFEPVYIVTESPASKLIQILAFGLVMAILVPLCGVCFCCCRVCCNTCGSKQPLEEGYDKQNMMLWFGAFAILGIVNIAFAGTNVQYSNSVTNVLKTYRVGIDQTINDVIDFGYSSLAGFKEAPMVATDVLGSIVDNVTNSDLPDILDQSFTPLVKDIVINLRNMSESIGGAKKKFNDALDIYTDLKVTVDSIPGTLQDIRDRLVALQTVNVNGTDYNIGGSFPDISALDSIDLPSTDSLPDLNSTADTLDQIPDPATFADQLDSMYFGLVGNLSTIVNEQLMSRIPELPSSVETAINNANNSFNTGVVQALRSAQQDYINNNYETILSYDSQRAQAWLAFNLLIILPIILAFLGPFTKCHRLMIPFPVAIVLLSFFIWLEFSLFFVFSAPVAILCNSLEPVLQTDYSYSQLTGNPSTSNNNGGNGVLDITTLTINPGKILDSCIEGKTVFEVSINSDNQTPLATFYNFLNSTLSGELGKILKRETFSGILDSIPDPSDKLDELKGSGLSSINQTALSLPVLNERVNLTSNIQEINSTVSDITPATIDPDLGDESLLLAKINDFNSAVVTVNPSFTGWDYAYIIDNYIIPFVAFRPSEATNIQDDNPANIPVAAVWYEPENGVLSRASFMYYSTRELNRIKNETAQLCEQLQSLQDDQINKVFDDYEALRMKSLEIVDDIGGIFDELDVLAGYAGTFKNTTNLFLDLVIDFAKELITDSIDTVINKVLLDNPAENFGKCKNVAENIEFMINGVCIGVLDSFAGLWYSSLLLGIFLIFGCVGTMKAKKRVEFLQIQARDKGDNEKNFGKKQQTARGLPNGKGEIEIQATAPMTSANDVFESPFYASDPTGDVREPDNAEQTHDDDNDNGGDNEPVPVETSATPDFKTLDFEKPVDGPSAPPQYASNEDIEKS